MIWDIDIKIRGKIVGHWYQQFHGVPYKSYCVYVSYKTVMSYPQKVDRIPWSKTRSRPFIKTCLEFFQVILHFDPVRWIKIIKPEPQFAEFPRKVEVPLWLDEQHMNEELVRSHHVSYNTLAVTCTVGNRTRVTQSVSVPVRCLSGNPVPCYGF